MDKYVIVECVLCQHQQKVGPGVDQPMCEKCFGPVVPIKAYSHGK